MFKIAVCDNEKELCDWLEDVIRHSENGLWQFCSLDKYDSGEVLCEAMKAGVEYQLIFLDVELNAMDGAETGRYIRSILNDYSVQIVYITGTTRHAIALFENQPYNFLIKPLDEKKVVLIIKRIIEIDKNLNQTVQFVSKGKQKIVVRCKDILYAFSTIRKVTIHTISGNYETYGKLSDLAACLPETDFLLTHKSYLVNWLYIHTILKDSIILHDGTKIPVSQKYKKIVLETWLKKGEEKYDYT